MPVDCDGLEVGVASGEFIPAASGEGEASPVSHFSGRTKLWVAVSGESQRVARSHVPFAAYATVIF